MKTIILNQTNVVAGSNNAIFRYTAPAGAFHFTDQQISVSSVSMYYSMYNFTNTITLAYSFPTSGSPVVKTVSIPPGFYAISNLNAFIQSQMYANGHFLVDQNSNFVYYVEFVTNSAYYSVQLNCYAFPSSLPTGYTNPNSLTFPTTAATPQVTINNTSLQNILGFASGTFPITPQSTTYSVLSTSVPQVTPTTTLVLGCSLVRNPMANPQTILYSFSPQGVTYGGLISVQPLRSAWNDIAPGYYSSFDITIMDQNLNVLTTILDPTVCITLVIRDKGES